MQTDQDAAKPDDNAGSIALKDLPFQLRDDAIGHAPRRAARLLAAANEIDRLRRDLAEAERALAAARGLQEGTAQLLAEAREHQTCEGGKPYVCHALATARSELAEAERALDGAQQQLYEFAGWLSEHGENLCGMPNAEIIDIVDRFRAQRRD